LCGETWWIDGGFSGTKNTPLFQTIFFDFSADMKKPPLRTASLIAKAI
jgi:hypothetical protein